MSISLKNIKSTNRVNLDNTCLGEYTFQQRVGITANFEVRLNRVIDDYIFDVKSKINTLNDVVLNNAFAGEETIEILKKFVNSLTDEANKYCNKLLQKEQNIIHKVHMAYQIQDEDVSSYLNNKSNNIEGV